jgi:hypothetical protein
MRAHELLEQAHVALKDRAATRDQEGERSMALAVSIFGAMTGRVMDEMDGWRFMVSLKLARAARGQCHLDDWVDLAGYAALAGECQSAGAIAPESGDIAPENGAVIPPDSDAVGNHHATDAPMPPFVDDDDMGLKAGEAYLPNPVSQTTGD